MSTDIYWPDTFRIPVAFGTPWHGYETSGGLWRRDGTLLSLPSSQTYHRRPDSMTYLVDFGLPDKTLSAAETAAGVQWSGKAVLCGSDFAQDRYYSPIWGSTAAGGINFGRLAFPYKCADETVYRIRFDVESKSFKAGRVTLPWTDPATDTVLATVPEYLDTVYSQLGTGATPSAPFLNHKPNGSACALHVGWVPSGDLFIRMIFEYAITGGNASTMPTMTRTALVEAPHYPHPTTSAPIVEPYIKSEETNDARTTTSYHIYTGTSTVQSGLYEHWWRYLYAVDYTPAGARVEIGGEHYESWLGYDLVITGDPAGQQGYDRSVDETVRDAITLNGTVVVTLAETHSNWVNDGTDHATQTVNTSTSIGALLPTGVHNYLGRILALESTTSSNHIALGSDGRPSDSTGDFLALITATGAIGKTSSTTGTALGVINLDDYGFDAITGTVNPGKKRFF